VQLPSSLSLSFRKLGVSGDFDSASMARVAPDRGWYSGKIPVDVTPPELLGSGDFEYKVLAKLTDGESLVYPAVGTVVVTAMPQ
jgi:hypothetical protein